MATQQDVETAKENANLTAEQTAQVDAQMDSISPEQLEQRQVQPIEPIKPVEDVATPVTVPTEPIIEPIKIEPVKEVKAPEPIISPEQKELDTIKVTQESDTIKNAQELEKLNKFKGLMESGASREDLAAFANQNTGLKKEMSLQLKNFYKNKGNFEFQQKYGSASPESMYKAYVQSEIVVGDSKYNSLPAETKLGFEDYKARQDILATKEVKEESFKNDEEKVLSMNEYTFPVFSGADIRNEYEKLTNNPEISTKRTEIEGYKNELDAIDEESFNLRDEIEEKYKGNSQAYIESKIQAENKKITTKYRLASSKYNNALASYSDMKADVDREMKYIEYENTQAFQQYQIQLGQYNTDRNRMDNFALAEFEAKNTEIAEQRQLENTKALYTFQQDLENDNKTASSYEFGSDGKMYAIIDNKAVEVTGVGGGEIIFKSEDGLAQVERFDDGTYEEVVKNDDGTIKSITTYTSEGNIVGVNPGVVEYIKQKEGFRQQAYDDATGKTLSPGETPKGTATIGYGFTSVDGKPVIAGDTITEQTANIEIQKQIQQYQSWENYVTTPLSETQKAALTSMEYNGGSGVWNYPNGIKLIEKLNAGDNSGAADFLVSSGLLTTSKGKFMKGLANRREEEAEMLRVGYTPSEASGATQEFKTDAGPSYEDFLRTGKFGTDGNREALIKEFGSLENFRQQAEAYNNREGGPKDKELSKVERLRTDLNNFLSEDNEGALDNSIGSFQQAWTPGTKQAREDFLTSVQSFVSGQTLQSLIDAKADGATFGALSNEELKMLQNSASKLAALVIQGDKDDPSRITGFRGSKQEFKNKVTELVNIYDETINSKRESLGLDKIDLEVDLEQELNMGVGSLLPSGNDVSSYFQ